MHPNEPVLILCGGRSTRMGSPKPLLSYQGSTLIARQVANARPHRPVWLAAAGAHYAHTDGAHYLPDQLPEQQGALSAILPALLLAKEQGFNGLFIISCDTLLLPETLITLLSTAPNPTIWQQGITACQDGEQLLPLLAHWSVHLSAHLHDAVHHGFKRVQHFVRQQAHQTVDLPKHWSAQCHFNTPEAFQRAIAEANMQAA